jgi:hypothetical protein
MKGRKRFRKRRAYRARPVTGFYAMRVVRSGRRRFIREELLYALPVT